MDERGGRGTAVNALVNGVVTGTWYALPDVVTSRPARACLKVAMLLGGSLAVGYGTRAVKAVADTTGGAGTDDDAGDAGTGDDGGSSPGPEADLIAVAARLTAKPVLDAEALGLGAGQSERARRVKVAGVALAALSVVGSVAGERAIHRWGQRLTARGVRCAHTRIGLVAGVATGVSTWALGRALPTPSAPS